MRKGLLALCAFVCFAGAAQAESVTVRLAGLDLSVQSDVDVAFERLTKAAKKACKTSPVYGYNTARLNRQCAAQTLAATAQRINAPLLVAKVRESEERLVVASR